MAHPRADEGLARVDLGALGRAALEAARAAGIGVTVSRVEPPAPRIVYASEAAVAILGRSVEDLLERDPMDNIAPEDLPRLRDRYARRAGGEHGNSSYEMTIVRGDGSRVPIEATSSTIMIDGRPAIFTFIVDIRARRAAEQTRRRSEARFRELIDNAPEPICIFSEERFAYANAAAARALGYESAEEVCGAPFAHFISPEEVDIQRARLARLARGEQPPPHTYHVKRKDGSIALLEISSVPFEYEGKSAILAMARDVTERRRTEERFRELIDSAPEPIGIVMDDQFVYVNRAYVRALRYDAAQEMYGRPLSSLVTPDQAATQRDRVARMNRGESLPAHTYNVLRKDGTMAQLEASSVPFEYGGRAAILTMARDVTERKQLQERLVQTDRLAALGTMAAGVAHEINNPLAYVLLNLEWIGRNLPSAAHDATGMQALMEMIGEAREGADRIAAIVRELRSFSRADGETRRAVDLAHVVQSAIKIAGHEIRHRANVTTSFDGAGHVWANEARLEQVVLNLLLNASQAMPEGREAGNEIRVTVRDDGDRAVLEVTDNGVGIPAEVVPRIFDPFFTTKAPGLGTGLGLSICHGIVSSLGGQITLSSEPDRGTTFRIVLPATQERADEPPSQRSDPPSASGPRARVLVVDDEVPIANTLRDLLSSDHEVVATTNARDALAAVRSGGDFDVVFCDLMMPGMNGMDLYERLRAERPGFERRIVFMTGGAFTTRAAEFLSAVDNRRVEKPFSLSLVERIVREMAAARSVAQQPAASE